MAIPIWSFNRSWRIILWQTLFHFFFHLHRQRLLRKVPNHEFNNHNKIILIGGKLLRYRLSQSDLNLKSKHQIAIEITTYTFFRVMIWRVIFEECPHQESRQVVSRKNCDKFRKYQMFLFTLLPDDSVSRACQVSQTVRWRFGTIHRGITKPFISLTGLPYSNSELSWMPYFSSQQKNVNKKKKKKVENFTYWNRKLWSFRLIKTYTM